MASSKAKKDDTIMMNDTLLFSKNFPGKDKIELAAISRELKMRILIETSKTLLEVLDEFHKLDFGYTMISNGIKRANQRAFKMEACQLIEIDVKKGN
ncbi:hypothetical protein GLOIN_2v1885599 [Rhizophagus irregularis DAOM 181602=DAOM 197198]|uniref:Uncharacterized protein n=1 Tax=Rhizophagus irregularis (strain DAOM 181602 / DAOM 197198 / MUCL 43194) TaxID=747089 RepID=U9SS76_RHIID|nr:hypothetical protein GLOIN_2v1885599 [Rhizophagus irregularis DAOM 181602=DAOM 197198]POG58758.1 hypothetical protein GLOIN_2v1885599 [Rhizophagus irregularis DAOM 181602=DAOM 197198]|eukprot:XP_025165624.1 hypothetical protein GLOIN_2v1885599 [Rhizophagus irregularis DAOM 181602=DAOM 197198]